MIYRRRRPPLGLTIRVMSSNLTAIPIALTRKTVEVKVSRNYFVAQTNPISWMKIFLISDKPSLQILAQRSIGIVDLRKTSKSRYRKLVHSITRKRR